MTTNTAVLPLFWQPQHGTRDPGVGKILRKIDGDRNVRALFRCAHRSGAAVGKIFARPYPSRVEKPRGVHSMDRPKAKHPRSRRSTTNRGKRGKTAPAPRQGQRSASRAKETRAQPTHDLTTPTLSPCSLFGPDGKERPAWELRVGDISFGRADSKESLLAYYARLHQPMPSGHWRERSWQPPRRGLRHVRSAEAEQEARFDPDELEATHLFTPWG